MMFLMRASRPSPARAPFLPAAHAYAYRASFTSSSSEPGSLRARTTRARRGAIVPGSAAAADAAAAAFFSGVRANSTGSTGGTIPGRLSDADHAKEAVVRHTY